MIVLVKQLVQVEFLIILDVHEGHCEPEGVTLINKPLPAWCLLKAFLSSIISLGILG
jgi:hypothetical protein